MAGTLSSSKNSGMMNSSDRRVVAGVGALKTINFRPLPANPVYFADSIPLKSTKTNIATLERSICPLYPACIDIKVGDKEGTWKGVKVRLNGVSQFGSNVLETLKCEIRDGEWVISSNEAYARLNSVLVEIELADGDKVDIRKDVISLGYGKAYGLGVNIKEESEVLSRAFNGVQDSGTINLSYSTFELDGEPDGEREVSLVIVTGLPGNF